MVLVKNPVERMHRTVADGVRAFLIGAGLEIKFWPFAFRHFLRIRNDLPHRGQNQSPLKMATRQRDDFTGMKTFGYRVWVRPPGKKRAKFKSNARKGIFLGYLPHTNRIIIWYDVETERAKIATHCRFDEGFNNLPADALPINIQHLIRSENRERKIKMDSKITDTSKQGFYTYPFTESLEGTVTRSCTDPYCGLPFADDELYHRVYVKDIAENMSVSTLFSTPEATRKKMCGTYITVIDGERVFDQHDAIAVLDRLYDQGSEGILRELCT